MGLGPLCGQYIAADKPSEMGANFFLYCGLWRPDPLSPCFYIFLSSFKAPKERLLFCLFHGLFVDMPIHLFMDYCY